MRFSGRERSIVLALREGPASGAELATRLGVSRRTVLRDIARANDILRRTGAGLIEAEPIYRLSIQSQDALDALLSSVFDDETAMLLAILSSPRPTVMDVEERTGLSNATVRACVGSANRRYSRTLSIEMKSGRGIEVVFEKSSPADFVAALAARDCAVLTELQTLAGPWMTAAGLMSQEIESFQQEMEPWLTLQEARTQVYAAIVTAPFELGEPLSLTVARASIDRLISRKRDLHSWLLAHRYELIGRASDLLASHGMRVSRPDLPTVMFEHIARSAMFTTLMTDEFRTQVNRIRIDHPIEFDFAQDLCEYLESLRKDVFLEHELCALYVIGTGLCSTGQSLAILLLCGRRSLESVNRAMLENTFDNVTVTSVYDVQSAEREYGTGAYSILIRDDSFADKGLERLPWNLVCRGILSDADLAALKRAVTDSQYRTSLPDILPEVSFAEIGVAGDGYLSMLSCGLELFLERGVIRKEEVASIMARECQGQCLRFNGVAVPHCITLTPADRPRLLALTLDTPVKVEDEPISLIIVVLVSKRQEDKSSIFSYLYSMLGTGASPHSGMRYQELLEVLEGNSDGIKQRVH